MDTPKNEQDPLLPRAAVEAPALPQAPVKKKPKNGKDRKRHRPGWWKKMSSRLKSETKISYRPYNVDLSTRPNADIKPDETTESDAIDEEKLEREKWKVIERFPQIDASLVPTLGITLWLGPQGVVTFLILHGIVFASDSQRALLAALVVVGLAQPRDSSKRSWSDIALILCIYVIIIAAIYLKSATVLTLACAIALPLDAFGKAGFKMGKFIAAQTEKYFAMKITLEDEAALNEISERGESIIFAVEPHDFIAIGCMAYQPSLKFLPPGHVRDTLKCLVSSAILNTPFFRHISLWIGCQSVHKSNFRNLLSNKHAICFCPGGVQEVFFMNPSEPQDLILYLKNRKGFTKLALEYGVSIVPSFTFGLDGTFACHIPSGDMIKNISRRIGFLPAVFWGRWYIPFGIPRPKKLHVVIGKPIHIPCLGKEVSSEDIEKYHEIVLKEFENLFERHKVAEEFYLDRNLKII